jgi:hypothetical protein
LFTFCMQSNGCRSWRWTEEKATRRGGGLTTEETSCGGETGDWNWLQVAEQEERRRRKSAGERERGGLAVYALPLVRSWVDGNDSGKAGCGGGGRCCCCRYWRRKKMKMMVLMGYCRCGGKRRCFRWRGINVVERVEDELVAAWLGVAESTVERERDLLQKKKKNWGGGWFFVNFGLDFLLP